MYLIVQWPQLKTCFLLPPALNDYNFGSKFIRVMVFKYVFY